MRFTHNDTQNGFLHELSAEIRNDVWWVVHRRTDTNSGKTETEGRMCVGGETTLGSMFASVVLSITQPLMSA
ncbi:hypothetical protein [Chromobacterium sp. ASV23]|uniref:hypothetical protein n=1 Tax=Chromobacterium sp. ASV23 TaxID=2795110 RepID=UPI0018EC7C7A|nr:hypothetical protein [Chromobacterium sp. ASV23]